MEGRVQELLRARIKASGWNLPERATLLREISAEKDEEPIKALNAPRQRLKKIGGEWDKENSIDDHLNVTRVELGPSKKPTRVLADDSADESAAPVTTAPKLAPESPIMSPIVVADSPGKNPELHQQQLLALVNDIENMHLSSVGGDVAEVDSSAVSEAASPQIEPNVAPTKEYPISELVSASPASAVQHKSETADEPSESSVAEREENGAADRHQPKMEDSPVAGLSTAGEQMNRTVDDHFAPQSSADDEADDDQDEEMLAITRRVLEDDNIFHSPIPTSGATVAASPISTPAAAAAIDSPIVVRRGTARRVILSDSEEKETPIAKPVTASKLQMVYNVNDDSEEETKVRPETKAAVRASEESQVEEADSDEGGKEESAEEEEDDVEDEDLAEDEEAERKRPRNPFIDSEADEESTPEKPKLKRKSRKSDVWLVNDDAEETVLSEGEDDEAEKSGDEEPAGETLHSEDDGTDDSEKDEANDKSEIEEKKEKEEETEVPKTPAKKTATSQPIMSTPISKVVPSALSITPMAHTPGSHFQRNKAVLTATLFAEYNRRVFGNKLDPALMINWTNKLKTTAGRTMLRRCSEVRVAVIELEAKVVDTEDKLRRTLLHELCHAAAWVFDNISKPPHGRTFWKWADAAKRVYPQHEVHTCHSYVINFKHHWKCARCAHIIGRHSKSIKATDKCPCGGILVYQTTKPDGTPRRTVAVNPYTDFVKDNFAAIKARNPGVSHAQVMAKVSEEYKKTPKKATPAPLRPCKK